MSKRNHRRDLIRKMWRYAKWARPHVAKVPMTNLGEWVTSETTVDFAFGNLWRDLAYQTRDQLERL